jgi:mono/diheme cytochrome c family protein
MRTRGIIIAIVVVLIVAAVFAWRIFNPGPTAFAGGSSVALSDYRGADPTGVPADLANADIVKRGEYLARAADCRACHTVSRDRLYAGGLPLLLPFGTLYSTNITPDKETGIGNYSDQDFLNAVQRGIRPDGTRLYPAMPYPSYTRMTDADALAIKAYLFSLPAVHAQNQPDTFSFPYNQRWLMTLWSAFFNENTRFQPHPVQSEEWNRGAYVAEALAHCGECHTPRNLAQALDNRNKFAGALTAGWYAFNITSDKGSGIGAWTDDEVRSYLSAGHASGRGTAAGPMGEAVDQSFTGIAPSDIHALVTYLRSVPPIASADLPGKLAPPAPDSPKEGTATAATVGKRVFEGACVHCHNWSGVSQISPLRQLPARAASTTALRPMSCRS